MCTVVNILRGAGELLRPLTIKAAKQLWICFIALIILAGSSTKASADDFYWTGNGGNSNWNNTGNWYNYTLGLLGIILPGYPNGTSDRAFIGSNTPIFNVNLFTGINQPTVNTAIVCSDLTIGENKAATVTMSSALTVTTTVRIFSTGTLNATATFTLSGSSATITNAGIISLNGTAMVLSGNGTALTNTGSFSATGSPITFGTGICTLNNSGTFSALSASNISMPGNGSSIKNTAGTFTVNGSNLSLGGDPSSVQNSGTGSVNIAGATTAMGKDAYITNAGSGSFTIKGLSVLNFGISSYITNSATFYMGISGSACTLNMTQQDNSITNNSGALFYLGAASVLNLTGSHATVTNSGRFTLQSDATGSAAISNISGGGGAGLTGYYNVERFLTGGGQFANRGYRMLSSPVNQSNSTASASTFGLTYLNQHTYLNVAYPGAFTGGAGGTANGFSGTSIGPTIYLYKESLAADNTNFTTGKHVGVAKITTTGSPASTTTGTTATVNTTHATDGAVTNLSIPIGNGFLLFFVGPGNRTTGSGTIAPLDATLTANGYLNQGNFTVHLWQNATGVNTLSYAAAANKGYNMVGNPYPSTINLASLASDNPGIDNIYVFNSRTGGANQNYIAYSATGGSSSPLAQQYAVSGGGFIVHATSATATLTFKESQKTPTVNPTATGLIMSAPGAEMLAVNGGFGVASPHQSALNTIKPAASPALTGFFMKMEKDSTVYDYCGIYFSTNYAAKFENGDALYLPGPTASVTLASQTTDKVNVAINNLPDYHTGMRIKLNVNASATGLYKIKLEGVRNIDTLFDIYLIDHFIHDSLDMRRYGVYNFNLNKTDSTTFGNNRFEISIQRKPLPQYLLADFTGKEIVNGIQLNWKTQNEENYTSFTVEKQQPQTLEFLPVYDKQSDGNGSYNFTDTNPYSGTNIYRLKQNTADGTILYSQLLTVFYDKDASKKLFTLFPNPTVETINLSIQNETGTTGAYKVYIYNSLGYLIMQNTSNSKNWSQNISALIPGNYIIEVVKSTGVTLGKAKFVKM